MNTLITQDRLNSLVNLCAQTDGDIVEVGVYKGGSLKVLAERFPNRNCYGFDTFEGLPAEDWREGEVHQVGDFNDTSLEQVREFLSDNKNVTLIKGFFPATMVGHLHPGFVHVDTDFYEGVKSCIDTLYPKLHPGGIMAFDDYKWRNCPGVEQALKETDCPIFSDAEYQAYIKKP